MLGRTVPNIVSSLAGTIDQRESVEGRLMRQQLVRQRVAKESTVRLVLQIPNFVGSAPDSRQKVSESDGSRIGGSVVAIQH